VFGWRVVVVLMSGYHVVRAKILLSVLILLLSSRDTVMAIMALLNKDTLGVVYPCPEWALLWRF
jgi:hypothetical protein